MSEADDRAAAPHRWPVRVYYEDTDATGVVYHAAYLDFAERARTEMLRARGIDRRRMRAETGLYIAVRDLAISYRAPARLDDALEVHSWPARMRAATAEMAQEIRRGDLLLARLDLRLVCLRAGGRPARWPAALRVPARGRP